ncbi:MAG: glycosyltransferase family 4 protein [Candidatus Thorarchaeota archaeon]
MSDRAAATFSHAWAMVDSVNEVVVVRETKGLPHPKVKYFSLPSFLLSVPVLKSVLLLLFACLLSWVIRPDLICAVQMHPHGYYGFFVSKLSRRPLILHTVSQSQGGLGGFIGRNLRLAALRKAIALKAVRHASATTTTGDTTRQNLVSIGIPPSRVISAPSITDANMFYPLNTTKIWDLVTVTRFEKLKRLDIFLRVIEKVSRERPIKAAIGGSGPEEENLRRLSSELGLDHVVTFLGWIGTESELNTVLNRGRIFLLTSQTEGFPTTISESMCAGTCCVAADVGDVSTVIDNKRNGVIVSPFDNVEEYKTQILRILDNDDYAEGLRQEGLETCSMLSMKNRAGVFKDIIPNFLIKTSND